MFAPAATSALAFHVWTAEIVSGHRPDSPAIDAISTPAAWRTSTQRARSEQPAQTGHVPSSADRWLGDPERAVRSTVFRPGSGVRIGAACLHSPARCAGTRRLLAV